MKKILLLILSVTLIISGCGKTNEPTTVAENTTTTTTVASTTPTPTTETTTDAEIASTVYPFTFKDARGRDVTIEKKPERIIPLTGSTLAMLTLAGGEAIAAASLSDNAAKPDYYDNIEKLGHMANIDVEKLISLEPDFVIVQGMQSKILPILEENNINYMFFSARTYSQTVETLKTFSKIIDKNEVAQAVIEEMEASKQSVLDRLPKDSNKTVAIVYVSGRSISLKLENSIAGDVVKTLGVKNIVEGSEPQRKGSDSTPFDLESIVMQNPDYILITSMVSADKSVEEVLKKHITDNTAWNAVPAVAEGRVFYLPQSHFLFNPLDKYPEAMEMIAETLWPEEFK